LAITDVVAAIGPPNGPMLLGQSVLQRLHRWSVDNAKHVFSAEGPISPAPPFKLAPDAEAPPPPNANGDQAQDHHVPRGAYDTGPVVDAHGNGPSRAIGETHDCAEFYPSESRMIDEAGDVLVGYDVAATGVITNVHLVRTSGSERLDQAAIVCVSTRWRNTPAMQGGKPVASPNHQAIIRFSLH